MRSQAVLRWLFVVACLVLVLSGVLYLAFWVVGLNEATEYRGHGSPKTESWLRAASVGFLGSGAVALLSGLLLSMTGRRAGSEAKGERDR